MLPSDKIGRNPVKPTRKTRKMHVDTKTGHFLGQGEWEPHKQALLAYNTNRPLGSVDRKVKFVSKPLITKVAVAKCGKTKLTPSRAVDWDARTVYFATARLRGRWTRARSRVRRSRNGAAGGTTGGATGTHSCSKICYSSVRRRLAKSPSRASAWSPPPDS